MKKLTEDEKFSLISMLKGDWSCDLYEWVPCINETLTRLGYEDRIIHDGDYDDLQWSDIQTINRNKPLKGYGSPDRAALINEYFEEKE